MIGELVVAFFATVAFSALFNVPRDQYIYCGVTGAIGWMAYLVVNSIDGIIISTFVATAVVTALSRGLAVRRKTPITVFLISGIFPLVPGAGIYYTVYYLIMNDNSLAVYKGLETIKIAVAISLGIMFVLALPYGIFQKRK